MKKFFEKYWPFMPLVLIITIALLLITIAVIGDIYSYWSVPMYNADYQSDGLYNDNSMR